MLCDTLATIRRVSSSACFFLFSFFFIHQLVSAEKRSDLSAAVYYKERPLRGEESVNVTISILIISSNETRIGLEDRLYRLISWTC